MKLRDFLDKQSKDTQDIKIQIVEIKSDLKHHIKRTDMLEDRQDIFKKTQDRIQEEIKPLRTHVAVSSALTKWILAAIAAGGSIAGIYKIFLS
jgi:chromosome segregation ATPase